MVLATCAATYALIVLGGVVRATGSGDACPDWPRCHGELIPPFAADVYTEFSHRLLASLVGWLVLATALLAWRLRPRIPAVLWGASLAVVLVAGQVVLGGVTVLSELPSTLVMAHLAMASALLATLLVVAIASLRVEVSEHADKRRKTASFRTLALVAAVSTFVLMMTGAYVSGTGASLAFLDWPLFDGSLLPGVRRLAVIHATHRLAAVAVALLLLYVAAQAWRSQRLNKPIVVGSTLAVVLYTGQVMAGAANIWTLMQPAAIAAHVALAVGVWGTLIAVATVAHRAALPATEREIGRLPRPMSRRARAATAALGGAQGSEASIALQEPSETE